MSQGTGKIVLGVLTGLAVGALLGVLFAPAKGSETRKKIAQKGEDLTDDIKDRLNKLIDELNQKIGDAKMKASNSNETTATN